jgi:hypothetical protein
MPIRSRVELAGVTVTVTALTPDQRVAAAQFRFDSPLDDTRYLFLCFQDHSYRPCKPPPIGGSIDLGPAQLHLDW